MIFNVAVQGCCHNELNKIYECVEKYEDANSVKISLLLVCGDIQSIRNNMDMASVAVPQQHKKFGDFYEYYSLKKKAPVMTIIIGGNHESSAYFMELPYGGWICPNIYYLGYAGVVWYNGLRIAGISGIYKKYSYELGHYETIPLDNDSKRAVYHERRCDVERLKLLSGYVDVFISHDWPRGIERNGDLEALLKAKPHFMEDIGNNNLGSEPKRELLEMLKPRYWFAAHMHVFYQASFKHEAIKKLRETSDETDDHAKKRTDSSETTSFVALDKIKPRSRHFYVQEFTADPDYPFKMEKNKIYYDPEWLAILRATDDRYIFGKKAPVSLYSSFDEVDVKKQLDFICSHVSLEVPDNFVHTGLVQQSANYKFDQNVFQVELNRAYDNPQTRSFCEKIGIRVPHDMVYSKQVPKAQAEVAPNKDQIDLDLDSD
ncbi:hypothetical protein MP638_005903 [Amoeboaphelidium occidentale]|nr:hypothetical protein MP638_005903 [Amoeboaphelidium occidentale]